jgi:hypothetical protein
MYANFDKIIGKDPDIENALKLMVVEKLFKHPKSADFSTKFTEIQLVGGIGLQGLNIARGKVIDKVNKVATFSVPFTDIEVRPIDGIIDKRITPTTNTELENRWRFNGIKHYLALYTRTKNERLRLENLVYEKAIKARIDKNISDTSKDALLDELVVEIKSQVTNKKLHANPDYRPATRTYLNQQGHYIYSPAVETPYLSFSEKMAKDIARDVKVKVIDSYQDNAIDAGSSILDALNPFSYFD